MYIFQKTIIAPVVNLKSKQKTVDIWKNMTVSDLASATKISVGKLCISITNYILYNKVIIYVLPVFYKYIVFFFFLVNDYYNSDIMYIF